MAAYAKPSLLGKPAPDFALPSVGGGNERLSEHRGEVVVVAFWSSRCSLCAPQLAALDALYATYHSAGLVTLAVSVDDDLARAREYANAHAAKFPLLIDASKSVSRDYDIAQLPTLVLIDRSGRVRYLHADYRANDSSYVDEVRVLLDDAVTTTSTSTVQ
ncbi:MAG: peroxiredoxin family protein [Steroidobacterales bacterium]